MIHQSHYWYAYMLVMVLDAYLRFQRRYGGPALRDKSGRRLEHLDEVVRAILADELAEPPWVAEARARQEAMAEKLSLVEARLQHGSREDYYRAGEQIGMGLAAGIQGDKVTR